MINEAHDSERTLSPDIAHDVVSADTVSADVVVEEQYQASATIYRSGDPAEILGALLRFMRLPFRRATLGFLETPAAINPSSTIAPNTAAETLVRETLTMDELFTSRTADHPQEHTRLLSSYPAYDTLSALEILQITDLAHDSFLTPEERARLQVEQIAGLLVIPLVVGQQLIGLVEVEQADAQALPPIRMRALRRLADQAAVVFQNRFLLESAETRSRQLAERVRVLEVFNQLATRSNEFADERDLLRFAIRLMVETLGVQHASVAVLEPGVDFGLMVEEYPSQRAPDTDPPSPMRVIGDDQNTLVRLLRAQPDQLLVIQDVYNDPRIPPENYGIYRQFGVHGHIIVSIVVTNQPIFAITLDSLEPARRFNEDDTQLAQTMGAQISTAVENIRLTRERSARTEQLAMQVRVLEIVNRLSQRLQQYTDERQMMIDSVGELAQAMKIDHTGIVLVEPGDDYGLVLTDFPNQIPPGTKLQMEGNPLMEAFAANPYTPLVVHDVADDARVLPDTRAVFEQLGIVSLMLTPVVVNNRLAASIGFDSYSPERRFAQQDAQMAMLLGSQLAVSIENIRLTREQRTRAAELAGRVRVLETLNRLSTGLTEFKDEAALIQFATEEMVKALGVDHGSAVTLDEAKRTGQVISEYPATGLVGQSIPFEDSMLVGLIKGNYNRPVIIRDVAEDPSLNPETRAFLQGNGIHGLTIAPILIGGKLFATIGFDIYNTEQTFSQDIEQLAQTMAAQVGIAVENIRLLRDAEQRATQATRQATREALINSVTEQISRTQDVGAMVDVTLNEMGRALGAQRARVRFFTPAQRPEAATPTPQDSTRAR